MLYKLYTELKAMKQYNFRFPDDLMEAVRTRAHDERTTATELVAKALQAYLSTPMEGNETPVYSNAILARCDELESRLGAVEEGLEKSVA
jgi:hypothetical protein